MIWKDSHWAKHTVIKETNTSVKVVEGADVFWGMALPSPLSWEQRMDLSGMKLTLGSMSARTVGRSRMAIKTAVVLARTAASLAHVLSVCEPVAKWTISTWRQWCHCQWHINNGVTGIPSPSSTRPNPWLHQGTGASHHGATTGSSKALALTDRH